MSVKLSVSSFSRDGVGVAAVRREDSGAPLSAELTRTSRRGESAALRLLARRLADLLAAATRRADALEQEGR